MASNSSIDRPSQPSSDVQEAVAPPPDTLIVNTSSDGGDNASSTLCGEMENPVVDTAPARKRDGDESYAQLIERMLASTPTSGTPLSRPGDASVAAVRASASAAEPDDSVFSHARGGFWDRGAVVVSDLSVRIGSTPSSWAVWAVMLAAEPTADVIINVHVSEIGDHIDVFPPRLVFTRHNW